MGIISLAHKLYHYVMTMWDTYGIDKATPYAKLNIQKTNFEVAYSYRLNMVTILRTHKQEMGLSYGLNMVLILQTHS